MSRGSRSRTCLATFLQESEIEIEALREQAETLGRYRHAYRVKLDPGKLAGNADLAASTTGSPARWNRSGRS